MVYAVISVLGAAVIVYLNHIQPDGLSEFAPAMLMLAAPLAQLGLLAALGLVLRVARNRVKRA